MILEKKGLSKKAAVKGILMTLHTYSLTLEEILFPLTLQLVLSVSVVILVKQDNMPQIEWLMLSLMSPNEDLLIFQLYQNQTLKPVNQESSLVR